MCIDDVESIISAELAAGTPTAAPPPRSKLVGVPPSKVGPSRWLRSCLVLTARRVDQLEKLAADIRAELGDGVAVLPVKLDVSDPAAVRGFVPSLPEEWRNIDVLVNNA